jgi:hypothetical protein
MAYHQQDKSWTQRTATEGYPEAQDSERSSDLEHHARAQGFVNAHTSLGVAGHLVHMGAMLFPVLAAEVITDLVKDKRAVRIGSVATTVLYEGLYTMREAQRRQRQEEKLDECRNAHSEHYERER